MKSQWHRLSQTSTPLVAWRFLHPLVCAGVCWYLGLLFGWACFSNEKKKLDQDARCKSAGKSRATKGKQVQWTSKKQVVCGFVHGVVLWCVMRLSGKVKQSKELAMGCEQRLHIRRGEARVV